MTVHCGMGAECGWLAGSAAGARGVGHVMGEVMSGRWLVVCVREGAGMQVHADELAQATRHGQLRLTYVNRPTPETVQVSDVSVTATAMQARLTAGGLRVWPLHLLARAEYRPTMWLVARAPQLAATQDDDVADADEVRDLPRSNTL